jgi:hypothetical protein
MKQSMIEEATILRDWLRAHLAHCHFLKGAEHLPLQELRRIHETFHEVEVPPLKRG